MYIAVVTGLSLVCSQIEDAVCMTTYTVHTQVGEM